MVKLKWLKDKLRLSFINQYVNPGDDNPHIDIIICIRLEDICNLLGKDWVALAYELGVSVATVNQIQAKRITAAEQAQLMLKLWKTQSGTKALGIVLLITVDKR